MPRTWLAAAGRFSLAPRDRFARGLCLELERSLSSRISSIAFTFRVCRLGSAVPDFERPPEASRGAFVGRRKDLLAWRATARVLAAASAEADASRGTAIWDLQRP